MVVIPSLNKVRAVEIWPDVLNNDTQLKQVLSTVNYVCTFINIKSVDMTCSLTELTGKSVPFVWTDKHTAAVKALKRALCIYTVLQVPDPDKLYKLKTNAFACAIGAVFEQERKLSKISSIRLLDVERRYAVYDRKLLALMLASKK